MDQQNHPAIALIIDAETTPALFRGCAAIEANLAVASQTDPERLPGKWVFRLALRLADVLTQSGQFDRAAVWIATAEKHAGSDPNRARTFLALARLASMRDEIDDALAAMAKASDLVDSLDHASLTLHRDVVAAELAAQAGDFDSILDLVAPHVDGDATFPSIDLLWRSLSLLGQHYLVRRDFVRARAMYRGCVDICEAHDAKLDLADALSLVGQCELSLSKTEDGLVSLRRASALAEGAGSQSRNIAAALIGATLLEGDLDQAITVARSAAAAAADNDDFRGFVSLTAIVSGLYGVGQRYEEAYRMLIDVYGVLFAKFGERGGRPIRLIIDGIKRDMGEEAFAALGEKLLAERKAPTA